MSVTALDSYPPQYTREIAGDIHAARDIRCNQSHIYEALWHKPRTNPIPEEEKYVSLCGKHRIQEMN